jgi:polyisoprenoid-binding protein YceI
MAWILDRMNTQIGFGVKHMMVTTVRGSFKEFAVEMDLNEQHPEESWVQVTIQANSVDTGVDYRDTHLRGEDFFFVEQFPTITYTSKSVEKLDDTHYRVVGDFTMRGVTHEVPLKFTVGGPFKNAMGLRAGAFSAKASISRKKFGMLFNAALESGGVMVADKVELFIQAEVLEPAKAAAS